jgi:hypothetical protein
MLDKFCPENGERECWKMWIVISGFCALGTLLLVLLKPWIEVRMDHEEIDPYVFSGHIS